MFPAKFGTPQDHRNLYRGFVQLIRKATIRPIRFPDLRYTAASLILNNGIPAIIVSKILRHASLSTTANLYGQPVTEGQQEAVRLIEAIAGPIPVALPTQVRAADTYVDRAGMLPVNLHATARETEEPSQRLSSTTRSGGEGGVSRQM